MDLPSIISIKERITINEQLKPVERDFVLACINAAVERFHRALTDTLVDHAGAEQVRTLSHEIRPLLHGKPQVVIGSVLAELLSLWVAGHVIPGSQAETDAYRSAVLVMLMEQVNGLIPASSREIKADEVISTPQDIARSDDKH